MTYSLTSTEKLILYEYNLYGTADLIQDLNTLLCNEKISSYLQYCIDTNSSDTILFILNKEYILSEEIQYKTLLYVIEYYIDGIHYKWNTVVINTCILHYLKSLNITAVLKLISMTNTLNSFVIDKLISYYFKKIISFTTLYNIFFKTLFLPLSDNMIILISKGTSLNDIIRLKLDSKCKMPTTFTWKIYSKFYNDELYTNMLREHLLSNNIYEINGQCIYFINHRKLCYYLRLQEKFIKK